MSARYKQSHTCLTGGVCVSEPLRDSARLIPSMSSVIGIVVVALVASLFISFTVGANSNSASIAPVGGANALSTLRGALLVGLIAAHGAVAQGGSISERIGHGLVTGVTITPLAATATLLTAATLITLGNSRGYPILSAFTVTGSAIGAGVALGGGFAVLTYAKILGFWFAIPIVEGVLTYGLVGITGRYRLGYTKHSTPRRRRRLHTRQHPAIVSPSPPERARIDRRGHHPSI